MKLKPKMMMSIGLPLLVVFIVMGIIIDLMASAGLRAATEVGMEPIAMLRKSTAIFASRSLS